jgi:hypothetical protein
MTTSKATVKPVDHDPLVIAYSGGEAVSLAGRTWCVGLKGWLRARLSEFIPPWGFEDEIGFHYGIPSGRNDLNEPRIGDRGATGA